MSADPGGWRAPVGSGGTAQASQVGVNMEILISIFGLCQLFHFPRNIKKLEQIKTTFYF